LADSLPSTDKTRIKANFEANCLNQGASAKVSSSRCVQGDKKSSNCEGKRSQKTGDPEDSVIYLRFVTTWPEANAIGIKVLKDDAATSPYSCSLSADIK